MAAYKREIKPTTETLRLMEDEGGLHIILAIKTSGQIRVANLLFCPQCRSRLLKSLTWFEAYVRDGLPFLEWQ